MQIIAWAERPLERIPGFIGEAIRALGNQGVGPLSRRTVDEFNRLGQ
jgi:hypothetical protein